MKWKGCRRKQAVVSLFKEVSRQLLGGYVKELTEISLCVGGVFVDVRNWHITKTSQQNSSAS
jgi:hypothetical protein